MSSQLIIRRALLASSFASALLISTVSLAVDRVMFLATEHYPPYNISNADNPGVAEKVSGYSTDVVRALFEKAGYKAWDQDKCERHADGNIKGLNAASKGEGLRYCIRVYPWKRALDLAQNKENHAVFSTIKSDQRSPLFSWVGPIAELNWVLMSKKGKNIRVSSIEDLKKYRIGGYRGDAIVQHLTEEQGLDVDQVRLDYLNLEKLERDRIDLWATSNLYGPYLADKNNYEEPQSVFVLKVRPTYIAFNKQTSKTLLNEFERALSTIQNDGTIVKISKKYGLTQPNVTTSLN